MMGENLASGSVYVIIDLLTESEVPFNKVTVVAALASSTLISTMKKSLDKCNSNNNAMVMFLFSVIGLGLLSLSALDTMANAQTSSNSNLGTSNKNGAKEMGICVVGQGGPCNGDSNWDGTHDVTGKCVLINGCGNNYNGNSNSINKNMNS